MKIATIIFTGFASILVFFSITTYVNYRQFQEVQENYEWVSNSQIIIREISRFQRNVIDMESGLRGYLLTGESIFLEPFDSAYAENAAIVTHIISLTPDTSEQEKNLMDILHRHRQWKETFADSLILAKQQAELSDSSYQAFQALYRNKLKNRTEKIISSEIRRKFRDFTAYEYQLREKRKAALTHSVADTRRISFALTTVSIVLGCAVAFYIIHRISRRIRRMVLLAGRIANGNFTTPITDTAKDELSRLSHSLNRMTQMLKENFTQLQRKNRELDQFAYIVSHDLKAPLRGIDNVCAWMEEDYGNQLPAEVTRYVSVMRGRVQRMETLIDSILAIARIGREQPVAEPVSVTALIREIVDMLAPDPRFCIEVQPDMPVMVTEKVYLQQVFINLISNALKHHHRANGTVRIGYVNKPAHYEFFVADDGPGIEPQYHDKIFRIFQTLRERDVVESAGVGLAIVKKILEDKQSEIQVISGKGEGATFRFTWPKNAQPVPAVAYVPIQPIE